MSDQPITTQSAGSQATAVSTRQSRTQQAIADAADRTGVDFSYLLAQARMESGLDPMAEARTSSATGLFQFIDQTWLATLDRHGDALGYSGMADAIEMRGGRARITDPAMRDSIMALRFDPQASSLMAGALAGDNRAALMPVLGREPDASELYMAHFLGSGGARRFLGTLASAPDTPAASILPAAARANRPIFYERSGAARSVADVMALVRMRVDRAMEAGPANPPPASWAQQSASPVPNMSAPAAASASPSTPYQHVNVARAAWQGSAARPSMAQTLQSSFSLTGVDLGAQLSAPGQAHVRSAYAKLEAFGL